MNTIQCSHCGEKIDLPTMNKTSLFDTKQAYALGYFFGRTEGSYGLFDLDSLSDELRHEFKLGYDAGVTDYSIYDIEGENNED